jgi:hypothetical protein
MAEEKSAVDEKEPGQEASDAQGTEKTAGQEPIADEVEEALEQEPIDPTLIQELKAAEADFRAAEKAHLQAKKEAEKAADQLQTIISTVLDAAEVANKAASSASTTHKSLFEATSRLTKGATQGQKITGFLLAASVMFILAGAGVFAAMAVQMGSKIGQSDILLVKMSTQLIEFRDSLESVRGMNQDLMGMAKRNEEIAQTYQQIAARVEELAASLKKQEESMAKQAEEDTKRFAELSKPKALPPNPQLDALLKQVAGLEGQIKSQSKALSDTSGKIVAVNKEVSSVTKNVTAVTEEVQKLQVVGGNVNNLKRQLEALITLEQQRYKEALRDATRRGQAEAFVAFPKRDAGGPEGAEARPRATN